jgi:hypothetical protein
LQSTPESANWTVLYGAPQVCIGRTWAAKSPQVAYYARYPAMFEPVAAPISTVTNEAGKPIKTGKAPYTIAIAP